MTVAYASQKTIEAKGIPSASYSLTTPSSSTYTRPTDWLALPTITETDQKFVGLYAVFDNTSNYVAVSATVPTGSFQVDWGDGSSPQTYATGATAQYNYNYSTISDSTISTRGYKQVIVTITPVGAGLLTGVDLNKLFVNVPAITTVYNTRWLDIAVASPNLTSFQIGGAGPVVNFFNIEQVSIIKTAASSLGFFNYLFQNLTGLKSVPVLAGPANWNAANGMFSSCFQLINLPSLPPTTAVAFGGSTMFQNCYALTQFPTFPTQCDNATNMFNNCWAMTVAPEIIFRNAGILTNAFANCQKLVDASQIKIVNLGASTTLSSFFNGCVSLVNAPYLDTTKVTDMTSMFQGCINLKTVPLYNTITTTSFQSMFQGCVSLQSVPLFDTQNALSIVSMFQACASLIEVPNFNFINVTSSTSVFNACSSLKIVPSFNLSNTASTNSFFFNCTSIEAPGTFNTTKSANIDSMFFNCASLKTAPSMDTSNVTSFGSAFQGCKSLTSIPLYDTSKVTNFNSAFASTSSLETFPLLNLIKTTQVSGMFNISGIKNVPNLNTSNCTIFTNMFTNCRSLNSIPVLDTSKATTIATMFSNCPALFSIPDLNCANVTTSPAALAASGGSLSSSGITGLKLTHSYATNLLNVSALETIFTNTGIAATTQTLTVSGNPGATTVYTVTSASISITSVDASTINANIVPGMYVYGDGVAAQSASFSSSTSEVLVNSNFNPANGTRVSFSAVASNPGITLNQVYYTVNYREGGYFKLSLTPGGAPITLTTTSTGTLNYENYVVSVSTNGMTLKLPGNTGTGRTVTVRTLNTHIARLKNWTVSG